MLLERTGLLELGREVIEARREEQTRSQLALISDWMPDPSPITRLTDDLHPLEPVRGLGITPDELVDFYLLAYYTDYASGIREQLDNLSGPGTAIQRAEAALDPTTLPQRWKVEQFDYALSPVDERPWGDVIAAHPKTAVQLPAEPFHIWPGQFVGEVFAWTLPHLEPLVTRFKQFDAFNVVITAQQLGVPVGEVKDDDPQLAAVRALPWQPWLDAFVDAFTAPSAEAAEARAAFDLLLAAERELGLGALDTAMREASSLERQHRVESQFIEALRAYKPHRQLAPVSTPFGELVNWDVPGRVLDELARLVGGFGPEAERPLHETAAMLELADALHDALATAGRFDLLVTFHPRIEAALADTAGDRLPLLLPLLRAYGTTDAQIAGWVQERATRLMQLKSALETTAEFGQRQLGFQALLEGGESAVAGVGHSTRIPVGQAFTIDGVTWTIRKVHRAFTYHPTSGPVPGIVVIGDRDLEVAERAGLPLLDITRDGGKTETIAADDVADLDTLSRAVTLAALVQQLQELALLIEGATNVALDLVEFVPGAGQIVMATRLVAAILEFLNSPEFDQLVDELLTNPRAAFVEVAGLVSQVFTPEQLWRWMLFGGSGAAPLRQRKQPAAKALPKDAPKTLGQRIAHLVRRLLEAGRVVFQSLLRTQTRIRWQVEATQLSVLRFPLLARVLRLIGDNLDLISQGVSAADQLEAALDSFGERIVGTATEIANFELPLELIPPEEIVDVIVQLVLARLPGKYKIAGTVILRLLDLIGQREAVFKAIAAAYPPELDPNLFWQAEVHAKIAPQLKTARDEFAASIFDLLAKIPPLDRHAGVLRAREATVPKDDVTLKPVPVSELLEAEPLPAPGGPAAPGTPVALPSGAGSRLSTPARAAYESRLGHDLGHVRVHDTSAAAAAARRVGARALTSGSNVYLGPGLAGRGGRVLAHELAHVVQQTGPRPLGSAHSDAPSKGRPARGLVVDPRREAQAEAVAAGRRAALPAGAEGVEPNFNEVLLRAFLGDLPTTVELQSDAERAATRPAKVPAAERKRVPTEPFMKSFTDKVTSMGYASWLDTKDIRKAIENHLGRRHEPHIEAVADALDQLLLDSLRPESEIEGFTPKPTPKGKTAAKTVWATDPKRLAVALARVVFAETGILVQITIGPPGTEGELAVTGMIADYVHLPELHGNNALWKIALDGRLPTDERPKIMPRLAARLANKSVTSEVWDKGRFRLTDQAIEDAREAQRKAGLPGITEKELPPKHVYLSPDDIGGEAIGLRLNTHKILTANLGPDRNSHHITQFLLIEYFANQASKKPFPLVKATPPAYPGLVLDGDMPADHVAGTRRVKLGSIVENRAEKMPAISLSNPAHKTGHLHLEKEEGDELVTSGHSQGAILHAIFHTALGPEYVKAESKATTFAAYRKKHGDPVVAGHIHDAIQATYQGMRNRLERKLAPALVSGERAYFNKLAEQKVPPTAERLTPLEMSNVAKEAIKHGVTLMQPLGWGT
jgi:Domain of unknown function (DUF4157)